MGTCWSCCNSKEEVNLGSQSGSMIGKHGKTDYSDCIADDVGAADALTSDDSHTNGNGRQGRAACSAMPCADRQEKRAFYARIPPLGKPVGSGGGDVRRSFASSREASESKINALFETYHDQAHDAMLADGIERFCVDLDVRPEEFRVLLLAWKLNAEQMCRFTRQEFVEGCKKMRVDSIKSIQNRFPDLLNEVQDAECFKDLYRFTFKFGLDAEAGQRILPSDMAICLWKLVFSQKEPPLLRRWLDFLEKHPHVRGIPRDTWNMFLNFVEAVGDDLGSYDDAEAWPSLFDDFVEYENDQANQNISKAKDEYHRGGNGDE